MKSIVILCFALVALSASAADRPTPTATKGTKIQQTDAYGRIRLDKPSLIVKEEGRIVQVSPYGSEESHKQQYVIKGDRVYHANFAGEIQHNKPSWTVGKDGRVVENDAYGNAQYHKQQYVVKDGRVYSVDTTGRAKQPAYGIKK